MDLPSRSIAVTFDDAYETVLTAALPVLARLKVPATVFAVAGRLGADNQWPGQWRSIPSMKLCDANGLCALAAAGMTIGSHSWTHPYLPTIREHDLRREIVDSADHLEQIVGASVRHFAYPYGTYGRREAELVTTRFATGVTTRVRAVRRHENSAELPRIDGHDVQLAMSLGITGTLAMTPYLRARGLLRRGRRLLGRSGHSPD